MRYNKKEFIIFASVLALLCQSDFAIASDERMDRCEIHDKDKKEAKDIKGITYNIGAEERLRGDFVTNQNLGDFSYSPDTDGQQILSRTRANFSLKPVEEVEAFVEGQYYMRQDTSDYSKVNLYQAYMELAGVKNMPLEARIGRQELCYGSGFFIGTNDFYDGLVWDAAKVRLLIGDKFWIDGIAARYVNLNEGTSKPKPAIYGAYSSLEFIEGSSADLYFFYNHGGFQFFHTDLPDDPLWYTIGMRFAGKIAGAFDYEIEPLYQFGSIENTTRSKRDTISAYGGHVEAGYTFKSKYNPRLFTGYAFGSGENDSEDKFYTEFHGNVYNDHYIVGDTSLVSDLSGVTAGGIRASGMHVIIGGMSIDLHPKINLNIDYHHFIADKTPSDINKNLGGELNIIAVLKVIEHVSVVLSANRFFIGDFFKDAAGSRKDINYFYVQAEIKI